MAFTLEEAAVRLRKTKRWLMEWLRSHPADQDGEPYYTPSAGTRYCTKAT
jgi:hypothetical protein